MKTKVVQFVSFSSLYNENLQCELNKSKRFNTKFELEEINLENEMSSFEKINEIREYKKLTKFGKIIYWIRFNGFLYKKYSYLKGSVVNIQFVNSNYVFLLPFIKKIFSKVIISFWGSDLLRQEKKQYLKLRLLSNNADIISFETPEFSRIFKTKIGYKYDAKIKLARFGVSLLSEIDAITDEEIGAFLKKYKINRSKTVVAVGYNRTEAQQHIPVIDSIIKANIDRNKVFFVFPWTYGIDDNEYKKAIVSRVNDKYDYAFIEEKLSNIEVAALRCATDIMIQVQTTDVMSSSMLETLYAQNEIITGKWLPYQDIYNKGVSMNTVNDANEVGETLNNILAKRMDNEILENNKKTIKSLYAWNNSIDTWIDLYL